MEVGIIMVRLTIAEDPALQSSLKLMAIPMHLTVVVTVMSEFKLCLLLSGPNLNITSLMKTVFFS